MSEPARFDGSSDEAFQISLTEVAKSLDKQEKRALAIAMGDFSVIEGSHAKAVSGVHGLTFEELMEKHANLPQGKIIASGQVGHTKFELYEQPKPPEK